MKTIKFKVLEPNNIYSLRKCIRLDLDMEGEESILTTDILNFEYELLSMLPELVNHRCISGEDLGLVHKLDEGIKLHHLCGHIALALQDRIGHNVGFCSESEDGLDEFYVIYEYSHENTGIEAGRLAVDILNYFVHNDILDFEFRLEILSQIAKNEEENKVIAMA